MVGRAEQAKLSVHTRQLGIGRRLLLDELRILVPAGEAHLINGPNGAGKSYLLDVITGLTRHGGTAICLKGQSLAGFGSYRRWRAGLRRMFQSPTLPAALSGEDLAALSGLGWDEFDAAFPILGKAGIRAETSLGTLSYGRRRFAELVLALAGSPSAILIDEPLAGADPATADAMIVQIREAMAGGAAVLAVDHTGRIAAELATCCHDWPSVSDAAAAPNTLPAYPQQRAAAFRLAVQISEFGFDSVPRIKDATLSLGPGEAFVLVGPNGSGKSSLLRALVGARPRTWTGEVHVDKTNLDRVLVAPQPPKLILELSALDNMELMATGQLRGAGAARKRMRGLLCEVGLDARSIAAPAANLSGGEAAMVSLLGALISDAPLLLLDEPTEAMSNEWAAIAIELMSRSMRNAGRSFIIASHDRRLLDRIPSSSRVDLEHIHCENVQWRGSALLD